jgi:hypothetical protein
MLWNFITQCLVLFHLVNTLKIFGKLMSLCKILGCEKRLNDKIWTLSFFTFQIEFTMTHNTCYVTWWRWKPPSTFTCPVCGQVCQHQALCWFFGGTGGYFGKLSKTLQTCAAKNFLWCWWMMGGRSEGIACADPGARTPIGASINLLSVFFSAIH